MSGLEQAFLDGLRSMVREIVRDEIKRALKAAPEAAEYISTTEAARIAEVTAGTVRRWIASGRLPRHGAGKFVRLKRADLERLLAGEGGDLSPEELAERDEKAR